MSTDIHPHVEIKVNGKWEHYSRPHSHQLQRYAMFGKMAGVRDTVQDPICKPKGLPEDASLVTMMEFNRGLGDNYCASWFNVDELNELQAWFRVQNYREHCIEELFGYLFGNSLTGFNDYRASYPSEIEDVRLVFWFDC